MNIDKCLMNNGENIDLRVKNQDIKTKEKRAKTKKI